MAQHTPIPWMQHGRHVITGNPAGPIGALSDADAAYIVKACNMHEELVEVLEVCQVRIFMTEGGSEAYELARALLAKANE